MSKDRRRRAARLRAEASSLRRQLREAVVANLGEPVLGRANIGYEFSERTRGTAHGGMGMIARLVTEVGLAAAVRARTPRDRSQTLAIPATPATSRRRGSARTALIAAAMRLLAERAPSAITGRELADEANVNYGLVHHHFGGKDGVLQAGLCELRDDFVRIYGDGASLGLLTGECHPYLQALVRSQVDYPDTVAPSSDFPIGAALVNAVAPESSSEAAPISPLRVSRRKHESSP